MEAYYSNFTKQFRISKPKERLKVCFYHDYDTFLEVSGAHYGVLAYYRFVPPRELNFYYDRLRPEETTAIMFHEAQHYLSHLLNLQFNIPHNFGESFAEYYGGSRWDPEKKTMSLGGIQEGRLTEIQTDIQGGEKKRLEPFLRNQLGYDDYTWGWSFVHFMMETPKYAKDFHKFYVSLPSGKGITRVPQGAYTTVSGDTCLATFKKVMGVDDLDALEKEWHSYIDSKLQVQSVYGYEEAAFAALNTGRRLRATRFFEKAVAEGSKNPTVYLRYGEILRWKERDRAEELFRKGLGIDPLFPELYVALGRLLKWKGGDENEAEGKRLIGLAMELAPDDVETMLLVEDAMEKALPDAPAAGPED
jgi:tetratricopeptide (TPR) repeat protein